MKTKKTIFSFLLCFLLVSDFVDAKNVYVKLSTDNVAWASVVQDAGNVVVPVTSDFYTALQSFTTLDVIWVAKGEYLVSDVINCKKVTTPVALDLTGIKIYGGFKGTETAIDQRERVDVDGNGMVEPWEFKNATVFKRDLTKFYQNRMMALETAGSGVDGVTFKDNNTYAPNGGGVNLIPATTFVRNCIIRNMNITRRGSDPADALYGAGLYSRQGDIDGCLIENCSMKGGLITPSSYGGGVCIERKTPAGSIKNCVIRNNQNFNTGIGTGTSFGGGLSLDYLSKAENCVIYNNWCENQGGGLYILGTGAHVSNMTIANNFAKVAGGGIYCQTDTKVMNTVVFGNVKVSSTLNNITLVDPFGDSSMNLGPIATNGGNEGMTNNKSTIAEVALGTDITKVFKKPTTNIGYSGNASDLSKMALSSFEPAVGSALIDAGQDVTSLFPMSLFDLVGRARPFGSNYEIGAYESTNPTAINSISALKCTTILANNSLFVKGLTESAVVKVYSSNGALNNTIILNSDGFVANLGKGLFLINIKTNKGTKTVKIVN